MIRANAKPLVFPRRSDIFRPGEKARNLLLDRLPLQVRNRIENELSRVSLLNGQIIHKPGDNIRYLYFPITCMISVTVTMRDGRTVEAGAIGSREVVGINAFMGGREATQTEYIVQLPGDAIRIGLESMKLEFDRNTEMRDLMLKYTQAFIAQISQNVACNRLHEIDQRFARWLLEVRDRVQSDEFPLTHEFIAEMLGIRRAGVSQAAKKLTAKGIINQKRGQIRILDLPGLLKMSCECYGALRDEYNRLLD
jgi:CRP-like cAMP-binding protein